MKMKRGLALAVVMLLLTSLACPVSATDDVISLPADIIPEDEYTNITALRGIGAVANGVFYLPTINKFGHIALEAIPEQLPKAASSSDLTTLDTIGVCGIMFVMGIGYCILSSAGIEHAAENGIYFDTCVLCD